MTTTALIYHPVYLNHDTGPHHPERASRLQSIFRRLYKNSFIKNFRLIEPAAASVDDIALVHSRDYIAGVRKACKKGYVNLDPDTVVSKDTYKASLFAAGAVVTATDLIFDGQIVNAFCLVRPPGHHARPSQAMGFCIFNNVAIGVRYLQQKYNVERILIVDWDVHHGNGTEEIFYKESQVFYVSLHQYPHYPGTGAKDDIGDGEGKDFNLNIPMPAGSGDMEYINMFRNIIFPKVKHFKPEFIFISAGFDGHKDDPLSSLNLTETGYYEMTVLLREWAEEYSRKRIISVLEGGYNLRSLASSVCAHLRGLRT